MAVSKVMIETLSILGTLMDVGIFDQHDPFNCRKEGYSIWPAYRYKDA